MKQLTLCLIHEHPRVLLGMKKRGFGEGRWNGFGGKVHEGETVEEAAHRETKEEAGIEVGEMAKVGIFTFDFQDGTESGEVHVFRAARIIGEPCETEEMRPQWFNIDQLPLEKMMPSAIHWLPMFLQGKKFRARFLLDKQTNSKQEGMVLEKELTEVDNL